MFRGATQASIDAKGRMALPVRLRDQLSATNNNKLIVTIDTNESCLLIYPESEWGIVEEKIQRLPHFSEYASKVRRFLIGHATDVELDGNGRILLTNVLRNYAKLEKKAILLGQGKKIELWSETVWEMRRNEYIRQEFTNDDIPEVMREISL